MEINVKIIKILAPQTFTSSRDGSSVVKNTFVGETAGQYPKKIAFSVIGEDKFKQMNVIVGNTYNVSFDIESREWNGKWFTEASAWRALCVDGQQPASPVPNAQPAPTPTPTQAPANGVSPLPTADAQPAGGADDLPF